MWPLLGLAFHEDGFEIWVFCWKRDVAVRLRPKTRDDGAGGATVFVILCAEGVGHGALLDLALDLEADVGQNYGDDSAHLVTHDRGPEQGEHQAGIDRVTHEAVRAAAHQLVADFNGDGAAPVTAQVGSGPERESDPGCREGNS